MDRHAQNAMGQPENSDEHEENSGINAKATVERSLRHTTITRPATHGALPASYP
jgi:hypothetical protein